jgi:SAM-dependent methyltransferase
MERAATDFGFSGGVIRLYDDGARVRRAERISGDAVSAVYEDWPYSLRFARGLVERRGGGDLLATDLERHRFVAYRTRFMVERFGVAAARPRRVLDFGCGSGLSTLALARHLPEAEIVAADLNSTYLDIFGARIAEERPAGLRIVGMGDGVDLGAVDGMFDLVQLNAVFEHLLPAERRELMPALWAKLRPGGLFLLTETPWRWFPIETHTTSLPLVNYLPDALALAAARKSRRIAADASWETALREGLRGATVAEIVEAIAGPAGGVEVMRSDAADARDQLEVWWNGECRQTRAKQVAYRVLAALRAATGVVVSPWINLVLKKTA